MIKKNITLKKSLYKMLFKIISSFNLLIIFQLCFLEIFVPRNIIASQKSQIPDIEYLRKAPIDDFYILGPGDVLQISVSDNSELFNQEFLIDINGQATLLRLNKVYVSGLTIPELTNLLNKAYGEFVKSPNVILQIKEYKPIEVLIEGEVSNPGKYSLPENKLQIPNLGNLPTLIDVIKASGGLTENADLKNLVVIRNNNLSNGGGKIKSTINLYSALDGSAPSNNINIFNDDKIIVPFTDKPMVSEIKQVMINNLNPQFINVFVGGKVKRPGLVKVSSSAVLTEAIALAGGTKIIKGPVRFLRYESDGKIDKRKFAFKGNAKRGSYKNPYLRNGDVITIGKNTFNVASEIIGEVTAPLQGLVTTYGLYQIFAD